MPNHVHLIATPRRPDSMSVALGRTHADFARHFNLKRRACGHVWTFENRAALSPAQAAAFYGRGRIPSSFLGIVTAPNGSDVWNNGTLKGNFASQLSGILGGSANSPLCNGLSFSISVALGVTSGYIGNNVPGALQFASGGTVPGHGPGVEENPVASFGSGSGRFTFYQPAYPPRRVR
jgi:hypothetical protein